MNAFLRNYTSDVPVAQTLARIEAVLIRCGVSGITKEYDGFGGVQAVRFEIQPSDDMPKTTIRLPADSKRALEALWLDYANGDKLTPDGSAIQWSSRKKKKRADFKRQAERTAWKLVQDWIEVQMSMVRLKQAEVVQVFLPYIWDGRRTFFEALKENKFKQLPERTP